MFGNVEGMIHDGVLGGLILDNNKTRLRVSRGNAQAPRTMVDLSSLPSYVSSRKGL